MFAALLYAIFAFLSVEAFIGILYAVNYKGKVRAPHACAYARAHAHHSHVQCACAHMHGMRTA